MVYSCRFLLKDQENFFFDLFWFDSVDSLSELNKIDNDEEEESEEVLFEKEATVFHGVAARANFLSFDCPDL